MAEELSSQAEQLAQTISFFKVNGAARDAGATAGPAHKVAVAHVQAVKPSAKPAKALPAAPAGSVPSDKSPKLASASSPGRSDAKGITLKDAPEAESLGDDDFEEF